VAIKHLFAGVPVADFGPAAEWYERLLGRPPDMRPHQAEAVWQLGADSWIYVVADADRAGRALLTFIVDDLDELVAGVAERGVAAAPIETMSAARMRRTAVTDPEGNRITFAQELTA
jgi:catechol 2,3-dioxygenase-like lactoylglutathione lyase family enzyme